MSLAVRTRREGRDAPRLDGHLYLNADEDWIIEGEPGLVSEVCRALPDAVSDRLAAGVLLVRFGNSVGRVPAGPLGTLRIRSGKFDEADYERMLAAIGDIAAGLPYAAGASTALPFERTAQVDEDVLYHAFAWLRHVLGPRAHREHALRPALQAILRQPHRRLRRITRDAPLHSARAIDPGGLVDVACGRWPLQRARGGRVAEAFGGRLPTHIREVVAREDVDTPENRFVKAFLDQCLGVVQRMREVIEDTSLSARVALLQDCNAIKAALRPLRDHALWVDVGPMVHAPFGSTVLQHRAPYRSVFRHHIRMRLGSRLPIDPATTRSLLEVKNVATLYEIWSCFALIDAVRRVHGEPDEVARVATDALQQTVGWGFEARWPDGVSVGYNQTFSRSGTAGRVSTSVPLRPDLVLRVPAGPHRGLHVLDAKLKVEWAYANVEGTEGIDGEAHRGSFKRRDIHKMHAYRDAIPDVRSAWVLYPGTETRHYPAVEGAGVLDGVGAVPLPVGEVGEALVGLVGRLVGADPSDEPGTAG